MVICKACGGESSVIDSRPHKESIRRRRKCLTCNARWSTLEIRGTFNINKPKLMREAKRVKAQERKAASAQQN